MGHKILVFVILLKLLLLFTSLVMLIELVAILHFMHLFVQIAFLGIQRNNPLYRNLVLRSNNDSWAPQ